MASRLILCTWSTLI